MLREENLKESDCFQGLCVDRRIIVGQVGNRVGGIDLDLLV